MAQLLTMKARYRGDRWGNDEVRKKQQTDSIMVVRPLDGEDMNLFTSMCHGEKDSLSLPSAE